MKKNRSHTDVAYVLRAYTDNVLEIFTKSWASKLLKESLLSPVNYNEVALPIDQVRLDTIFLLSASASL